jgi:GntR family transcriptional repressor for pyruvate dehydrogenase complex
MYTPIRSGRLYEQIVDQIEALILNGKLKPGDKLPSETELAEQFSVSRTAVREAMKALIHKGLISAHSGRGTFVTDGTTDAVRESLGLMIKLGQEEGARSLVEVREILEPEIAAMAATRRKKEHLEDMRKAVATMEASFEDAITFVNADLDFHLSLADATLNPIIHVLIDTMVDILRVELERIAQVGGGMQRAQSFHKRILKGIEEHDVRATRDAMREHMHQVHAEIEMLLDQPI